MNLKMDRKLKIACFSLILSMTVVLANISGVASVDAQAKAAWKSKYSSQIEKVSARASEGDQIYGKFIYLNEDSIPEMYLSCGYEHYLFTYYKGKVKSYYWDGAENIPDDSYMTLIEYVNKKNCFLIHVVAPALSNEWQYVLKIKNGKFVEQGSMLTYGERAETVTWGKKNVSQKTFNSKVKKKIRKKSGYKKVRSSDLLNELELYNKLD